jgi:hypothetical protein
LSTSCRPWTTPGSAALRHGRRPAGYEAERIAAGGSIEESRFYDAFHAAHPAIAFPVGDADKYVVDRSFQPAVRVNPASVLPFAGVYDFLTAMYLRLRAGRTGRIGRPLPPGPRRAPGGPLRSEC